MLCDKVRAVTAALTALLVDFQLTQNRSEAIFDCCADIAMTSGI
jgi:hypothetical protein